MEKAMMLSASMPVEFVGKAKPISDIASKIACGAVLVITVEDGQMTACFKAGTVTPTGGGTGELDGCRSARVELPSPPLESAPGGKSSLLGVRVKRSSGSILGTEIRILEPSLADVKPEPDEHSVGVVDSKGDKVESEKQICTKPTENKCGPLHDDAMGQYDNVREKVYDEESKGKFVRQHTGRARSYRPSIGGKSLEPLTLVQPSRNVKGSDGQPLGNASFNSAAPSGIIRQEWQGQHKDPAIQPTDTIFGREGNSNSVPREHPDHVPCTNWLDIKKRKLVAQKQENAHKHPRRWSRFVAEGYDKNKHLRDCDSVDVSASRQERHRSLSRADYDNRGLSREDSTLPFEHADKTMTNRAQSLRGHHSGREPSQDGKTCQADLWSKPY